MKTTKSSLKGSDGNIFKVNENCKLGNILEKQETSLPSLPSIFEYLSDIPDYRNINNYSNHTTYSVSQLVILCIIGSLQGQSTQIGFVRFCKSNQDELLKLFTLSTLPSLATFNRLSKNVSFDQINQRLYKWLYECIIYLSLESIASKVSIDGKYLKGYKSKDANGKSNHQTSKQNMLGSISMFCQDLKIVLNSNTLEGKKESETHKFRDLLDHPLTKLITGDSLHCNRQTLEKIDELQKQYIIGLKGNCSKLKSSLDDLSQISQPYSIATDNTKKVLRNIEVFEINEIIKSKPLKNWSTCNIQALVKVTKISKKTGQVQVNSYISNINPKNYTAGEFALGVRKHWRIENNLHWHKDIIFGEDKHILKSPNPAFFFSSMYSFAIGVINLRNYIHNLQQTVLDSLRYNTNRLDRTLAVLRLQV
jgi:predicted transposase YbfD/YdcC